MTQSSRQSIKSDYAPFASAPDLVAALCNRERRAISAAITSLEVMSQGATDLLRAMQPHLAGTLVIGFTGPPGAGKSTLVNALIRHYRQNDKTVGVIAVDPSSPVTGGAILGDRIRMSATLNDDGVFMRSLASRGALGGLSPAAVRVIDAFDAAAFDIVLLETVGTGQTEIDVAEVADIRVVITAPGLGDDIQAMKAGLLEIADILVVNKSDREGSERTMHQLLGALAVRSASQAPPPVLKTNALSGDGVDVLAQFIDEASVPILSQSILTRRQRRARFLIARAAADSVARRIRNAQDEQLNKLADTVLLGEATPDDAAEILLSTMKD